MDIDLGKQSPYGHGTVTCFSLYGGVSYSLAVRRKIKHVNC